MKENLYYLVPAYAVEALSTHPAFETFTQTPLHLSAQKAKTLFECDIPKKEAEPYAPLPVHVRF